MKNISSKQILASQKGVALLLVMGVMAILSFLLFEFTFDTKLNKIKIYNQEDRFQARLNAEAGLNFALAKLRLYQEGRNLIEKNESIKSSFPPSDLEAILIEPFMYPIPISSKASIIQQNALKEFEKTTIFRGEMSVTISKISGLLNPNSLRVVNTAKTENSGENDQAANSETEKNSDNGNKRWVATKQMFIKTVTQLFEDKLKNDEEFHNKHANTSPAQLIDELIFYVNDANKVNGQEYGDAKNKFSQKNITPKHAPMASIEELYLLPSWDDLIINLLKDRMSVNELTSIPVNEINNADLKILFPDINDIQIEEFFKYRDGDPDKKIRASKFKSAEDFKNVVTGKLNIVSDSEYQKIMEGLQAAGLVIDTAGKLYKVNSKGVFNNANYTLIAIVDLPVKAPPKTKKKENNNPSGEGEVENINEPTNPATPNGAKESGKTNDNKEKEKKSPTELLLPRVVEIRAE